ncbi:HdeA/HdeB family chaperone [uncultured Shewanella sp.]|uniref:HdeA/HdeB family chaperone n=1 Tax=uncultured Shewanella sp. TaxID=173975 RepID=UPI00260F696D|nr:HdeA/HdeB family chaperone [uncultured Shewanella sp.]
MKLLPLVFMSLLFISPFSMAAHTKVKDLQCKDFLQVDNDLVPVVVGYLTGVDDAGNVDVIEIDQLENVQVDDVVDFCQNKPDAKVSDAVKAANKKAKDANEADHSH